MSFYKYQSAIGGEKEREKLVFVYMAYYQLRGIYTFLVCGGGDFFQYRLNVKNTRATFFPYLYVHINVDFLYTLSCMQLWLLYGGGKHVCKIFFYQSCCTLIWVRIIPVK